MKRLLCLPLLCTALALSSCAYTDTLSIPSSSVVETATPPPAAQTSTPSPEITPPPAGEPFELQDGLYEIDYPIEVTGGRLLQLRLHAWMEDDGTYSIDSIGVMDEDGTQIQQLLLHDAIVAEWGEDFYDGCATGWTPALGLSTQDMNFDGVGDIGLVGWMTNGANLPCYYWLWSEALGQFEYAFCLSNAEPDVSTRRIISATREGAGSYVTNEYEYDENGGLVCVRRVEETVTADGRTQTTEWLLQDGGLRPLE